jgi:hypothetical protein
MFFLFQIIDNSPKHVSEHDIGNDVSTNNSKIAIRRFLQREFPEIFDRESTPHNVIFMPESFIYKETEMVILSSLSPLLSLLSVKMQFGQKNFNVIAHFKIVAS